jgi:hypothetical protein
VEVIEGILRSPDGCWTVQVVRYAPHERWYRVIHGTTTVGDRLPIAAVQRILGDAYATLEPAEPAEGDGVA